MNLRKVTRPNPSSSWLVDLTYAWQWNILWPDEMVIRD